MIERLKAIFQVMLAFATLAGVSVAVYYMITVIWRAFVDLDQQLATALLGASATVVVAVITVVIGKQVEHRRAIEQANRLRKIEVYEPFLEQWFGQLVRSASLDRQKKARPPALDKQFLDFVLSFGSRLILWGGRDVIKQYVRFRFLAVEKEETGPDSLLEFERILFAMRKDIGLSNNGLEAGDLLKMFLTDPKSTLEQLLSSGKARYQIRECCVCGRLG